MPAVVALPLGNASSKDPSSKAPPEPDIEGGTQLAELVPSTPATGPLGDDAKNKLSTKDYVKKVLRYLDRAAPGSRKEFPGMGVRGFYLIQSSETEEVRKPRLTYNYVTRLLTINMPSILYEAPFEVLEQCFIIAIAALPYDRYVIRPTVRMNYQLPIEDWYVTPNMTITLTSVEGPTKLIISGLGEFALLENKDHVFEKMEAEIKAHPEAAVAVIVLMDEAKSYAFPQKVSPFLRNGNEDNPLPLSLGSFIDQRSTPRSFAHPVTVGDHQWCQVQSVEYFVWVKGEDGRPIDIRKDEPGRAAYGTLVPELDMEEVTSLLEVGLSRMRDTMVKFSKEIIPGLDCSKLEEAKVTLPICWPRESKILLSAVELTAHERYETWHTETFTSSKRNHDSTYCPPETALEDVLE